MALVPQRPADAASFRNPKQAWGNLLVVATALLALVSGCGKKPEAQPSAPPETKPIVVVPSRDEPAKVVVSDKVVMEWAGLLKGNDIVARDRVFDYLAAAGPAAKAAEPILLELLKDKDEDVQLDATRSLANINPTSAEA